SSVLSIYPSLWPPSLSEACRARRIAAANALCVLYRYGRCNSWFPQTKLERPALRCFLGPGGAPLWCKNRSSAPTPPPGPPLLVAQFLSAAALLLQPSAGLVSSLPKDVTQGFA